MITLQDETGASRRVPCAHLGERVLVLPAFTEWAGGATGVRPRRAIGWGSGSEVVIDGACVWPARELA